MNIKSYLAKLTSCISPKLFFNIAYLNNRGKFPDLSDPKDLSEILIRSVLDDSVKELYYLADKYEVRKYIIERGYENLLTPLIGVYSNVRDINYDKLPDQFAIKMNYGAGMNIICKDKTSFNQQESSLLLNKWLNSKIKYSYAESHYNLINRKIVIEEFIDDGSGDFPTDYKFMCVNGQVLCVLVCSGREHGHPYYAPYSLDWKYLKHYDKREHSIVENIAKPNNLPEMIKVASDLSQGIPFVRVDLYSNGDKIWFGEMTLTPSGCILHGWTKQAIDELGESYRIHNETLK